MSIRRVLVVAYRVLFYPLVGWMIYEMMWPDDTSGELPYFGFILVSVFALILLAISDFAAWARWKDYKRQVEYDRRTSRLREKLEAVGLVATGGSQVSLLHTFWLMVADSPSKRSYLVYVGDKRKPTIVIIGFPEVEYDNCVQLRDALRSIDARDSMPEGVVTSVDS